MIVLDLVFLSIPALLGSDSSVANTALAALITMPALWVAHAISYTRARECHEALKQEFGVRYTQRIERGELRISPITVLMTSMPAQAA